MASPLWRACECEGVQMHTFHHIHTHTLALKHVMSSHACIYIFIHNSMHSCVPHTDTHTHYKYMHCWWWVGGKEKNETTHYYKHAFSANVLMSWKEKIAQVPGSPEPSVIFTCLSIWLPAEQLYSINIHTHFWAFGYLLNNWTAWTSTPTSEHLATCWTTGQHKHPHPLLSIWIHHYMLNNHTA